MTATSFTTKNLVARASYCTEENMFTNDAFLDSITKFQNRFSDTLAIASIDSAQTCIKRQNLKCDETDKFKEYHCVCFK